MNVAIRLAVLVGCGLAACDKGAGQAAGNSKDGAEIYQLLCATCHGTDGIPPSTMKAKLDVRDLSSAEFRARVSPALVETQIRTGSKNKLMPSFAGAINDEQIKAVAAYVASAQFPKH